MEQGPAEQQILTTSDGKRDYEQYVKWNNVILMIFL